MAGIARAGQGQQELQATCNRWIDTPRFRGRRTPLATNLLSDLKPTWAWVLPVLPFCPEHLHPAFEKAVEPRAWRYDPNASSARAGHTGIGNIN